MARAIVLLASILMALALFTSCSSTTVPIDSDRDGKHWVKATPQQIANASKAASPKISASTYHAAGQLVERQGNIAAAEQKYQDAIKKAHDAEAKQILGRLRIQCAAIWMNKNDTTFCTIDELGLSSSMESEAGKLPGEYCWGTHFFRYSISDSSEDAITFTATRCSSGGKDPQADEEYALGMIVNFLTGQVDWLGEFAE